MKLEIRTQAAQLLYWDYLFRIFGIVTLQCVTYHDLLIPATVNLLNYTGGFDETSSLLKSSSGDEVVGSRNC
jgi:hypothetical protein